MRSLAAALALAAGLILPNDGAQAQEKIFGSELVGPGIELTFIAAPTDDVRPRAAHLREDQTDIHLEVLAVWTEEASQEVGAAAGAFVPYLHMFARIENERTGRSQKSDLVPHINRSDNVHYARNVGLPGPEDDPYTIVFSVHPPGSLELAIHRDWWTAYGDRLFPPATVTYKHLTLAEVAAATR